MRSLLRLPVLLWLFAFAASAKPWNGIDPGVSKREDVTKRFGEPSKTLTQDGRQVIAYLGKDAIKGTTQTQFRIQPETQVVERISVFPGPIIEKETVENSYGPACPAGPAPANPCFIKKLTDDFRTYYLYPRMGLAIFFNEDGKTVQSLIFEPSKPGKQP